MPPEPTNLKELKQKVQDQLNAKYCESGVGLYASM